jgi:hypothetical protein
MKRPVAIFLALNPLPYKQAAQQIKKKLLINRLKGEFWIFFL